jgi:ribonuclease VapC
LALVLDASALLAYLREAPGADVVTEAIAGGVVISTVNLAEVFGRAADRGADPAKRLLALGDLDPLTRGGLKDLLIE